MNKIYKLVWSKTKNMYVAASEMAKSRTKAPSGGVISRTVVAGVLACVLSCGAVMPTFAEGPAVTYDDDTKSSITLQGPVGTGTVLTGLGDGALSAASTDAVTGAQLYAVTQQFDDFQSALSANNTSIARAQTDINNMKSANIVLQSDVNTLKTQVATGFNVTIGGAKVKTVNPDSNFVNFIAGDGISITNDNNSVKFSVNPDGVVEEDNAGAITGGLAYTELRPADGEYVKQAKTTAENLTALDTQVKTNTNDIAGLKDLSNITNEGETVIKNLAKGSVKVINGTHTTVTEGADGDAKTYSVNVSTTGVVDEGDTNIVTGGTVYTAIHNAKNQIEGDLALKANADASNVGVNAATDNSDLWGEALGTGTIADGDGKLVTGGTVYAEVRPDTDGEYIKTANTTAENLSALDTQVKTNTDDITNLKNLSNITEEGETVIKNLSKEAVKVVNGTHTTVTEGTDGDVKTFAVNVATDGTVADGDTKIVTGDTVYDYIETVKTEINDSVNDGLDLKANADASNVGVNAATDNSGLWGEALGTGAIADGDGKLVTGGTVYNEVRPDTDGEYIKIANTTAENLSALDTQVKTNTGDITNLKNLSNITEEGETVIKNLSKEAVKVVNGTHTTVTEGTDGDVKTYAVNVSTTGVVDEGDTNIVTGGTVYTAIHNTKSQIEGDLALKANADASNIGRNATTDNSDLWGTAIGNGDVAESNGKLVTGGTMFAELRPEADGAFVKTAKSTAENLTALDTALNEAVSNIGGTLGNAVFYDGADKSKVTFGGASGTTLTNLKPAALTRNSSDAVIGSQLWATNQNIAGFANDINRNKTNIANLNTSVTAALESVSASSQLVDVINSTKADKSLNNLDSTGQQVIKNAAVDAVQQYMTEHGRSVKLDNTESTNTGDDTVAVVPTRKMMMMNPSTDTSSGTDLRNANPGAGTNYVVYDDAQATTITLEGPVGTGTKVTNLAEGELSAASSDAVTGSQLYTVTQQFDEFQSALSANNTSIARAQTDINNMKSSNIVLQSDVNTLKTQVATGFNVTIDGAKVKTVNPDSNYVDFIAGQNVEIVNDNESLKFDVNGTGSVARGNVGLISGDTAFRELRPADGEYVSESATTAENLGALDTQLAKTQDFVENLDASLEDKANVDASNIGTNADTDNSDKWGAALGTGQVAVGNGKLVTGETVYREVRPGSNGSYIKMASSTGENLMALDVQTKANTDAIENLQDVIGGDFSDLNAKLDAKANADASNVGDKAEQWGEAIGKGAVASGDKKLVSGDTVYKEVRSTNGNYVKTNQTAGQNISTLDTELKKTNDAVANVQNGVDGLDGRVSNVESRVSKVETDVAEVRNGIDGVTTDVSGLKTRMTNAENNITTLRTDVTGLQNDMKNKANADASNVAAHTKKWGAAIGTGAVAENNGELVTGGTVYQALMDYTVSKEDIESAMEEQMAGKMNTDMSNITDDGKQVIRDAVKSDMDNKANKDLSNLNDAGKKMIRDTMKVDLDKKANVDASNIDVSKWSEKLGTGEVAEGNTGLVNGDAVYEAIQSVNGTDLIGRDKEAGTIQIGAKASYDALDSVDISKSDGTGRVMRGVVTDVSDASSAANVGYVEAVAENVMSSVNNGFERMNEKVNKVGASAAAMASLMPAPMDGDEKWSMSAAVGNYRNSTAAAVGVFYKPQDNVIMNVRGSFGNDENMIGAGVAVALNRGNAPAVSKAKLVKAVNAQATKITEQDQIIRAQAQKLMELEERMNQMAAGK